MTAEHLDVEGKAGEVITLPIAGGPATGHAWRLDLPEAVKRIEDSQARPLDPSVSFGGAAGGHLQVTAPRGEYVITAQLTRTWEPDKPVRIVTIRLHVT